MIIVGIPVLNRYEELEKCIQSAEFGFVIPSYYFIVDNGGEFDESIYPEGIRSRFIIAKPSENLGVAASWNLILDNSPDSVIIVNDDIEFARNDIQAMVNWASFKPEIGLFTASGDNSYSFFLMRKWLYAKIGQFDTNFYPAYFEDSDHSYRMQLANEKVMRVNVDFKHVGSATLKSYTPERLEQHHQEFRKNRAYYERKWGGLPGEEIYKREFDRQE